MRAALRTLWLATAILGFVCATQGQTAPATTTPNTGDETAAQSTPDHELTHSSAQAGAADRHQQAGSEATDEEDAFKYSPAVQFVSRVTHVPLTAAYWLCVAVNFAILAVAIVLLMKSSLPGLFRGRTQEIKKGMDEARRTSEDAGRRLKDIEVRLSRLDTEIAGMQQRAESEARAEEERIRASIEEEKQKILQGAEQEIGQAANAARRELQKYAAELAIDIAKQRIKLDPAEDKSLVSDFAQQLTSQAPRNGNR